MLCRADEYEARGAADGHTIGQPYNAPKEAPLGDEVGAALRSNPKGRVFFGRIAALRRLAWE